MPAPCLTDEGYVEESASLIWCDLSHFLHHLIGPRQQMLGKAGIENDSLDIR